MKENKIISFANSNSNDLSERLRSIMEFVPDGFVQIKSEGAIISVNSKVTELTEYSEDELLSMNISNLFPENVLKENPPKFDLLKQGQSVKNERELITKNGNRIHVETNSQALPDGTIISFVRDVTERKKVEENIRISEARLRRAELASKSGNWELHLDTQMMIASEGATVIYGVDEDNLEFSIVKKVPLPEYRPMLDQALKELIEENKPYDIEFKIRAVDTGEIKDIHSIAVFDREKRILFGAIQDITQRKKIEAELIQAKERAEESDRLKTAFLQNLSHEIRTPMNAIMGFADLMRYELDNKSKLDKYSGIINQRCNDLLDIINDILDIAKIESGQLSMNIEECDINVLFNELTALFMEYSLRKRKEHIKLNLISGCNPERSTILTDKVKLKQILINLINNAFKFTDKGSITGGCRVTENNMLMFHISDTGVGIPPSHHKQIFERFTQLSHTKKMTSGGTGLGLPIVKGLVDLLGGEIHLESEPDKGSTFSFTIPYKSTSPVKKDKSPDKKHIDISLINKTVLIVEDDVYNTEYLNELLTRMGLNTLLAATGKEAVELSGSKPVDLVLMDIRLPDINGYEATRLIRQHKPQLKIIAQTAYAPHNEIYKAISAGCDDYLSKPTKKELLVSMLKKHLRTVPMNNIE